MNYQETLDFLYTRLAVFHREGKTAYKANLNNSLALDKYFKMPHAKYQTIHVAGTNGKGSVSHMLAAVLHKAGYKVGLFTSPHLIDFRERIRVNGIEITEQEVVSFVADHREIIEKLEPSFFELTSALAFMYFEKQGVDIAIIETGLGGRLDSTNIIKPILSIITNIGLDHTEFLGTSLLEIAKEKAGIIKQAVPIVIGESNMEIGPIFIAKAKELNAPITFAEQLVQVNKGSRLNSYVVESDNTSFKFCFRQEIELDLHGSYQQKNLATILSALVVLKEIYSIKITEEIICSALINAAQATGLKGRWQVLGHCPLTICDTGHNAHGLSYVMKQLTTIERNKLLMVFGVVSDKDLQAILPLLPHNAYYFFTQANIPRAMKAEVLAEICRAEGLQGEIIDTVSLAYQRAKEIAACDDLIFVGGSTFVVAEIV